MCYGSVHCGLEVYQPLTTIPVALPRRLIELLHEMRQQVALFLLLLLFAELNLEIPESSNQRAHADQRFGDRPLDRPRIHLYSKTRRRRGRFI